MFKHLIALTLFLLPCLAPAQTEQDAAELSRDLDAYRRVSLNLHYDSIIYFMLPAMLELAPKEELMAQIKQAFENEILQITMDSMTYLEATPTIIKAGEHLCAIAKYDAALTMTFLGDQDTAQIEMFSGLMKMQFGEKNVEQIRLGQLKIKTPNKRMIACKSPGFDSWKFIEDKRGQESATAEQELAFIEQVVPKEVMEATKN